MVNSRAAEEVLFENGLPVSTVCVGIGFSRRSCERTPKDWREAAFCYGDYELGAGEITVCRAREMSWESASRWPFFQP